MGHEILSINKPLNTETSGDNRPKQGSGDNTKYGHHAIGHGITTHAFYAADGIARHLTNGIDKGIGLGGNTRWRLAFL